MKDSIEIPIACIKCWKYGYHVMECEKGKKDKKDKTKEIRWCRDKTSNSTRLNDRSKNGKTRN